MHFFAQIKPKCHIHAMWVAHNRRSAELDHVLFKVNDDGIYESGELTDEQIDRFRSRPEIVKLIMMGVVLDATAISEALKDTPEREPYEGFPDADAINEQLKPKGRPRLKE